MNLFTSEPRFPPATFSGCRRYRYTLWRQFDDVAFVEGRSYLAVIGLNPSTADEVNNDNTVTRCINFARAWGYSGYMMLNLFAFRATDPDVMKAEPEPVGPENDAAILRVAAGAGCVLAAWGVHGVHQGRDVRVRELLAQAGIPLHCLGITKGGHPKHPLYIAANTSPIIYYGNPTGVK